MSEQRSLGEVVDDLLAWRDGMTRWKEAVNDRLEALEADGTEQERIDEALRKAETALAVANHHAPDRSEMSKQRFAAVQTRDYLVKQFDVQRTAVVQPQVTVSRVVELCEPEKNVHYESVKRAWNDLAAEWTAIYVTENEAGTRVCRCRMEDVSKELVNLVEFSLDRDGLANRFVSEARRRGWE